jgi:hypothetical protein
MGNACTPCVGSLEKQIDLIAESTHLTTEETCTQDGVIVYQEERTVLKEAKALPRLALGSEPGSIAVDPLLVKQVVEKANVQLQEPVSPKDSQAATEPVVMTAPALDQEPVSNEVVVIPLLRQQPVSPTPSEACAELVVNASPEVGHEIMSSEVAKASTCQARPSVGDRVRVGGRTGTITFDAGEKTRVHFQVKFPDGSIVWQNKNEVQVVQADSPIEEAKPDNVELMFDVEGQERRIRLYRRPLGAEFSRRSNGPTKVNRVHAASYAHDLGIEQGWILKEVAGKDVAELSFEETQGIIKNVLLALPLQK